MRVLVVGSCGKKKVYDSPAQPLCHDIDERHDINYWKHRFRSKCKPARDMYTGPQNVELVKAIDILRTIPWLKVELAFVSAGFGLLTEDDLVPPYDCSFARMKIDDVRKRSHELRIQISFLDLISKGFDLIYLALGKRYLVALGKDCLSALQSPTILFHGSESDYLIRVPCAANTVKSFSVTGQRIHGVVGFKGDLLRILVEYALDRPNPYMELKRWTEASYLRKLVYHLGNVALPL